MKIFYGVQGTGNGHITRARMMARELYAAGVDVTFLFTGRPAADYFEMDIFRDFQTKTGLTFATNNGQVGYLKTALTSKPLAFFRDKAALDLSEYDLVISDFEPLTSWAAKKQRKTVLGIGHQYAFNYDIPRTGADPIAASIMKHFAPADISIGLHWHHFGHPILPPIIDTPEPPSAVIKNKIIVYLPFENLRDIFKLITPFRDFDFHIYTHEHQTSGLSNIQIKPLSREKFQQDWYDSAGIISNAGFELASESLRAGKKILAKPLHAQMEQLSNALALHQLGFGQTMYDLDSAVVEAWLYDQRSVQVTYTNVAQKVVQWILKGMPPMDQGFIASVWDDVNVLRVRH